MSGFLRSPTLLGVRRRPGRRSRQLAQIAAREQQYASLNDAQVRKAGLSLRYRAKSGRQLVGLIPDLFALVREAANRSLGMRPFDVQVQGGIAMAQGCVAEMQTGEGKTLAATLPLCLYALAGQGSHLITANDYLAKRDADLMKPLYQLLGLTVGVLQSDSSASERRKAYGCDITYGTTREFGFDFLRDRLALSDGGNANDGLALPSQTSDRRVQRNAYFALIDEADCILIDEARTPLVIGTADPREFERTCECYRWAAAFADRFQESRDYCRDQKTVALTPYGRQLVRCLPASDLLHSVGLSELYESVERAISVRLNTLRDQHYIVKEGRVVIVDERTGRLAEGRQWQHGLHQAIEAKEDLDITVTTAPAARITVQDLFLRYRHLAGMTGTAVSAAREFRSVYGLRVVRIPTHRPPRRQQLPTRVFRGRDDKWTAVLDDVRQIQASGRPILIGTRTIEASEHLSGLLKQAGIEHRVLNANNVATEADIVSQAGQQGRVTVATNMAGRGTDIPLDSFAKKLGGLHVVCTELHESARIDRQLIGRCARQGDPGSYREYMSLEDDVLTAGLRPGSAARLRRTAERNGRPASRVAALMKKAQRQVERKHFRQRMFLLHHERHRRAIQQRLGQDPYLESID